LLECIFDRYEYLEMKGFVREKVMTASLESVYVPLLAQGTGERGRVLRGGELGSLLVREETGEPTPLSTLLPRHRCLVIVGEAGAGKSTFLRHVALTLARAFRDRHPTLVRQRLDWETRKVPLPIILPLGGLGLFLRGLDDAQKESPNPDLLLDYIRHHFRDLDLPDEFFETQLKREEHCLVLLDGLDEVAHFEDRVLISQTVTLLAQRYEGAHFVVTCRPEGYRSGAQLGADFRRTDIEPLRWPDDIKTFVLRWNEAVLQESRHAAHDNAQDFLHRLEGRDQVRALANNPLLLTVMIIVHFNVGQLPERRADLYDNATELLLGWDTRWRRKLAAPPPWLDAIKPSGKRLYLEELGYHWQQQGTLEMRREEAERFLTPFFLTGEGEEKKREATQHAAVFLDWVLERTYLLRPLGNSLSFYRRAFQEYLAARRLARELNLAAIALAAMEENWDWWEETVLLAVDHLSASDPTTNAQFARFIEGGSYDNLRLWTETGWTWRQGEGEGWGRPPERRGEPMYWRDARFNQPNQPVVGVTWFEAVAYARWLTHQWQVANGELRIWQDGQVKPSSLQPSNLEFRLPTEAEWEKAARGTDGRTWSWGNDWDERLTNTVEGRGDWTTAPVGLHPGGASPYGALDLIGNVWEWTSTQWGKDWQKPDYELPYRPDDGREDPEGTSLRVLRGGSWLSNRLYARCASRDGRYPDLWFSGVGLRLVVSPVRSDF